MTRTPSALDATPIQLQGHPLARAAVAACCTDARWVWMNQFHPEVKAKCAADPVYAETFNRYLPLGGYIVTGVWQP